MSRIDDLVARMCPDGVEYKPLGRVGEFIRGNGLQKSDLLDHGFPAVHYGQVHTLYWIWTESTASFVSPELAGRLRRARPGDLIIATTSEDDGGVAKATAWVGEGEVAVSGDAYIYRHTLDPKYVAYFVQSDLFRRQKMMAISGTKVRRISGDALAKIRIPTPPVEVQREIASVLDMFGALNAELNAELDARRAQYVHFRESLLASDGSKVQEHSLGKVAKIVRGASPRPIQSFLTDADSGVPWIKIGDVAAGGKYITRTAARVTPEGAAKSRRVYPGDFVLSNSMSFGRPYISKIEGCIHDGWLAISDFGDSFLPDFLYHLLRSVSVQSEFARRAGAGTVQNLNADIVKSVAVPVPSLSEQQRIVSVLDRFETLVNDETVGIPAELNARRQQYEYYRDKLMTFKELSV